MYLRSLYLGVALVLTSLVAASSASDVISFTALSFETIVPAEPLILVRFCSPWSGNCNAMARHYEQAATSLKAKNIKVAKVDCLEEAEFCEAHKVHGYPTLKVFRHGSWVSDYVGSRQADDIVNYMLDQSLPAASEVTSGNHEEFQQQAASNKKVDLTPYLTSQTDAKAFHVVAKNHRDRNLLFDLSTDHNAIAAARGTPPPAVAYRKFDDPKTQNPLPPIGAPASELEERISDLSIPLIDDISAGNRYASTTSPKYRAYLFLDPSDTQKEARLEALRPIARKYRSKIHFAWIDAVQFSNHARALNLEDAKWPAFVIQDSGRQQLSYPLDQGTDVTPESVEDWVRQLLGGELKPALKSAPIPETQDGPVFALVAQQFDEVVFDDSKDVFLELYTTWCGHCEHMKPVWDSLAAKYAPLNQNITIAKMDMQENDLPPSAPFQVSGFPTMKFKPAGTRTFVDYDRHRTLEDFVAFVEEHAANRLAPVVPDEAVAQMPLGAAI